MSDAVYNKEQIMEIIPHRDPFLLIDDCLLYTSDAADEL